MLEFQSLNWRIKMTYDKSLALTSNEQRQLDLFFYYGHENHTRSYIDVDLLPRCFEGEGLKNLTQMKSIERQIEFRGKKIYLTYQAAPIKQPDKTYKFSFPGKVEDHVYRALRYLLVQRRRNGLSTNKNGKGLTLDFTIYEVRKHLWDFKKLNYNTQMIDEAIKILSNSVIQFEAEADNKKGAKQFSWLNVETESLDINQDEKTSFRRVQFSNIEYESLEQGKYIAVNYKLTSGLKTANERKILDYIFIKCRNANKRGDKKIDPKKDNPDLIISLETILQFGTINPRKELSKTISTIYKHFKDLKEQGFLIEIEKKLIKEVGDIGAPKYIDCIWNIWLSDMLIEEIQQSLNEQKDRRDSDALLRVNGIPKAHQRLK